MRLQHETEKPSEAGAASGQKKAWRAPTVAAVPVASLTQAGAFATPDGGGSS